MPRVRVHNFTISLDGYGAGPDQGQEAPLGHGGEALHHWYVATRTFQKMLGKDGGTTGTDDEFASSFGTGVGAYILGRNMFGPVRGTWPDNSWRGWWGKNPPYHCPVFVLTHHPREPEPMTGGTVFHFVTGGIHEALERARDAAGAEDVQVGGGVSTVRQYLQKQIIDEMHIAISPIILGGGEHLLYGLDLNRLGYRVRKHVTTDQATHVVFEKA